MHAELFERHYWFQLEFVLEKRCCVADNKIKLRFCRFLYEWKRGIQISEDWFFFYSSIKSRWLYEQDFFLTLVFFCLVLYFFKAALTLSTLVLVFTMHKVKWYVHICKCTVSKMLPFKTQWSKGKKFLLLSNRGLQPQLQLLSLHACTVVSLHC